MCVLGANILPRHSESSVQLLFHIADTYLTHYRPCRHGRGQCTSISDGFSPARVRALLRMSLHEGVGLVARAGVKDLLARKLYDSNICAPV